MEKNHAHLFDSKIPIVEQYINYYEKYGKAYTQEKAFEYINQMANIDLLKILKYIER